MSCEILTLKEVAEYLKWAEKIAYRLAAEGKLQGSRSAEVGVSKNRILKAR